MLIVTTGRYSNAVKIRPPLVFQPNHAGRLVASLELALKPGRGTRR